ncbi:MAG: prepilin-type N-terminal cleavage/methylation domain-containing protein [Verrucomicrobiota bacterium]
MRLLSNPSFNRHKLGRNVFSQSGFSLVEISLALAVMGFAFTTVFGLLGVGMQSFHDGVDCSATMQIAQQVINEVKQTDFDTLISGVDSPNSNTTFRLAAPNSSGQCFVRYFDEQCREVAAGSVHAIYNVNVRVLLKNSLATDSVTNGGVNLATVTVQVVPNPGNLTIPWESGNPNDANSPLRNLWKKTSQFRVATYSAQIARE